MISINNKKWPIEKLQEEQKEVLKMWPTGQLINLDEAFEYHKKMPKDKNAAEVIKRNKDNKKPLLALRGGFPSVEEQIEHLLHVQQAGADLLPITVDSYTRNLRFKEAGKALNNSANSAQNKLNGFPVVNHGVKETRKIVEAVDRPITLKHGSVDARLVAETAFASGITDLNGNVFSWGLTYNKNVPIDRILKTQQYIDRLAGYYTENDVPIAREQGGGQGPGCFRLPCISLSNTIMGAMISVAQGVKTTQIAYGQGTNLVQDVAALRVLKKLGNEYIKEKFDHKDVTVTTIFHQWQGAFPLEPFKASAIISLGATTGVLGGANQIVIKSIEEGVGVPSKEANAAGVEITKRIVDILGGQRLPESDELLEEMHIIELETRSIIDATLEIGKGDLALGIVKGIEAGIIDVPFTPSIYNCGKAIPVRDINGAFRFLDSGNMPFPEEVLKYHERKIKERSRAEGGKAFYNLVMDDVNAMCSE